MLLSKSTVACLSIESAAVSCVTDSNNEFQLKQLMNLEQILKYHHEEQKRQPTRAQTSRWRSHETTSKVSKQNRVLGRSEGRGEADSDARRCQ